jgi:hypothetical protein
MVALLYGASQLRKFNFESPNCNPADFEDEDQWDKTIGRVLNLFSQAISGSPGGHFHPFKHLKTRKWTCHVHAL